MSRDLEPLIFRRFEELAGSPMFPDDIRPDDFELQASLEWLGAVRDRLLLDVGCARGRFVRALTALGARVVGLDPTWGLLRGAAQDSRAGGLVLSTATRLPFATGCFDGALCIEVIEHIPEIDRAFAEMARVLKPGRRAIIIDKNLMGLGYQRFYPNWLYKALMERSGRWSYPEDFPFRERWFLAGPVARRLRRHFSRVEVRYLDGRIKGRRRLLMLPLIAPLPFLRPDIAWCCEK